MAINHPQAIAAVALAIISFYGMTYVVLALNVGWRFGYWLAGSCLSALLFLMSIFWMTTGLGPRGAEGRWIPIAADRDRISQAAIGDKALSTPGQYPTGPWQAAAKGSALEAEGEALNSGVQNCLTTKPEKIEDRERKPCTDGQSLLPSADKIPVIEGAAVAMLPEVTDVRFATENGALLAEATIVPLTRDPRVAKNVEAGAPLGPSFVLLSVKDKGTLRVPAFASFAIFSIALAFHLIGLNRAEKRKLSPIL